MSRARVRYRTAGLGLVLLLGLEFCAAAEVEYGEDLDVLDEDSSDGASSFEAPSANSPRMTVVSSKDESIVLEAEEECGHANADGQEITELVLNRTVHCKVSSSEAPRIFCYRPPQFNIWRALCEVRFEVTSLPFGNTVAIPYVHSAAEDSLHGIIDTHVKAKRAHAARAQGYLLPEMIISPIDLLTECPRPWARNSLACQKSLSPFGRSCVAVSLPPAPTAAASFTVRVTLSCGSYQSGLLMLVVGMGLLVFSRQLSKSKLFCYAAGVWVSVLLGAALLLIFILRRIKLPGANSMLFGLVAVGGYGFALLSATADLLQALAIDYWEFLAGYVLVFTGIGAAAIYRARASTSSKASLRTVVLWSIRSVAFCNILSSTHSGGVSVFLFVVAVVICLRQASLDKTHTHPSQDQAYSDNPTPTPIPPQHQSQKPKKA